MTSLRPTRSGAVSAVGLALLGLLAVANSVGAGDLPIWRQLMFAALALAAYLHGRHLRAPGGGWALAGSTALAAALGLADLGTAATGVATLAVFVVAPWLAGRNRGQQAELARLAVERVAHLEREHELVARRAQAEERARIATDLHDLVGHDLALIAVRAGALEVASDLDPTGREVVAGIRAGAVEATDRLRAALGAMRAGTAVDDRLAPVGESVEALVARAVAAGLDVRLEGSPAATSDPAGSLAGRAAHRVVQEALTNAAKHAPGATVTVRVERSEQLVRVAVTNAGGQRRPGTEPAASGSGLLGLAERVRLVGGTFAAGPEGDGFAVRARIPAAGEAA